MVLFQHVLVVFEPWRLKCDKKQRIQPLCGVKKALQLSGICGCMYVYLWGWDRSLNIVFIVCKTKLNRGESALSLGKKTHSELSFIATERIKYPHNLV